jgi:hypothetical protein
MLVLCSAGQGGVDGADRAARHSNISAVSADSFHLLAGAVA